MIRSNLTGETNIRSIVDTNGRFSVIEYRRDISVGSSSEAIGAYYSSEMNRRKKQLLINLNNDGCILQAGAMQLIIGNVNVETGIKGVGSFMKKAMSAAVTNETAVKPIYTGVGQVLCEPTYKYLITQNTANWGGRMVVADSLFLACDSTLQIKTVAKASVSSALLSGTGMFNTMIEGNGLVVLESPVPEKELLVFDLENDTLKVDGNFALAWSSTLQFTTEKTTKTLIGSAASGEGLVNVFRGTGRILVAPVMSRPKAVVTAE